MDENKLKASSSGGICTALSEMVIEEMHGVVYGVTYSSDYRQAEYSMASCLDQLADMRGSKYITAKKKVLVEGKYISIFESVIENLKKKIPVLFIGVGCDVAALCIRCANEGIDTSTLYTVDLICHGTTLDKVHTDYIEWLVKKYRSEIKYFNVRYKKFGWTPPFLHVEFENGRVHEENFYTSDYGKAFAKIARDGCYRCIFKGENHKSDLTVGDYWGIKEDMPEYNRNGVSIIFIHTKKGNDFIEKLDKDIFRCSKADFEKAIAYNPMYMKNRKKDSKYEQFCNDIKKRNLIYALLHYEGFVKSIYWRIKDGKI